MRRRSPRAARRRPVGSPIRVLLDTNVWSTLSDAGVTADQLDFAVSSVRRSGRRIALVASPSVLVEALAIPPDDVRNRIVELICDTRWQRLRREIESEVDEIVNAARIHQRAWVRPRPDLSRIRPHIVEWERGIWADPEGLRDDVTMRLRQPMIDRMHAVQADQLAGYAAAVKHTPPANLSSLMVTAAWIDKVQVPLEEPIQAWRFTAGKRWWDSLLTQQTIQLFAAAFLDLQLVLGDTSRWGDFWFHRVAASQVPRTWLRWAVDQVQMASRKPDRGNLVDQQHSTYLVDADLFVTRDRALAAVLERVTPQAPVPVARPVLLRCTPEELFEALLAVIG